MTTMAAGVSALEITKLQQRVEQLEAEVRELKQTLNAKSQSEMKPGWKSVIGIFDGDPFFEQMVAEGRKWREAQRPTARAKSPKVRAKRARS
jgi:cell division septum initiation protein DivIVA